MDIAKDCLSRGIDLPRQGGAIRLRGENAQASDQLLAETQVGMVGFVAREAGVNEFPLEELVSREAAEQVQFLGG